SAPAFLRGGFRPFFFGAALWAALAITVWLGSLAGDFTLPSGFDPLAWHRHEMLFGFVGAAVAGFFLTAIPNWTGRLPIAGPSLAGLFGIWVAARIAVFSSGTVGILVAAVLDVGFFLTLASVGAREVILSKNRNLPVVGILLLFALADAGDYLATAGAIADPLLAIRVAIGLITVMISLIGGRITPSFTRNWLARRGVREGLPTQPGGFDKIVIGVTALALLFWVTLPVSFGTGVLLVIAAGFQAARLSRWKGWRALPDPLLLILHVGYLWIPVGLLLLGLESAGAPIPQSAAVHALTAGAMGTMILAVMSRASLGHTGRDLRAGGLAILAYVLVTAGAVVRVTAYFLPVAYMTAIDCAGVLWAGAMAAFLIGYAPVLWTARADDPNG
ncbi:MAG TPA: NnrS family protein, partial [Chloroflexota bacterium]|nr:NnrS family protein [Chloroflexota bacterium]